MRRATAWRVARGGDGSGRSGQTALWHPAEAAVSGTGAAPKAPPRRWRDVYVALAGPGAAASQRTGEDELRWLGFVVMAVPVLIIVLVVWLEDFSISDGDDFMHVLMALVFLAGAVFIAVTFAKGLLEKRFAKITIADGVVRGRAINGFSVPVDRWEAPLEGHRIRPVRIPQRLRERPTMFTVSDGPVRPFGAAAIRLEHPTMPERSVVLIRENNVPADARFPLEAEAAEYAAHLALPLAELVDEPEFVYPPPRPMNT
jgi:hypothetical protein